MNNFNALTRLAKQNLVELQRLDDRIRRLYLKSEQAQKPEPQEKKQAPVKKPSPPPKTAKVEIKPKATSAPIAFANILSNILHKDRKLKLVTRDFTNGKCSFDNWVDAFFEACQTTYNGMDYTHKVEDAVNILLGKGYSLEQDNGFLTNMREVAKG